MATTSAADAPDGFRGFTPDEARYGEPDKFIDRYEEDGEFIRVVGFYDADQQEWSVRKQVKRDGDWRTSMWGMTFEQTGPNDHPLKLRYPYRFVKQNTGGFVPDDGLAARVFIGLLNAAMVFKWAVTGQPYRLLLLHDEDWSPEDND